MERERITRELAMACYIDHGGSENGGVSEGRREETGAVAEIVQCVPVVDS